MKICLSVLFVFVFGTAAYALSAYPLGENFSPNNEAVAPNARFQIKVDKKNLELTRINGENYYQGRMPDGTKFEAVFFTEVSSPTHKRTDVPASATKEEDDSPALDSWSIVWYIASFGGLIAFFLIVSCSEWCCRKRVREQQAQEAAAAAAVAASAGSQPNTPTTDVPPPAYDLFAPPAYDSCLPGKDGEKREFDIYVVPAHAIRPIAHEGEQRECPPAYTSINVRSISSQTQNIPT